MSDEMLSKDSVLSLINDEISLVNIKISEAEEKIKMTGKELTKITFEIPENYPSLSAIVSENICKINSYNIELMALKRIFQKIEGADK